MRSCGSRRRGWLGLPVVVVALATLRGAASCTPFSRAEAQDGGEAGTGTPAGEIPDAAVAPSGEAGAAQDAGPCGDARAFCDGFDLTPPTKPWPGSTDQLVFDDTVLQSPPRALRVDLGADGGPLRFVYRRFDQATLPFSSRFHVEAQLRTTAGGEGLVDVLGVLESGENDYLLTLVRHPDSWSIYETCQSGSDAPRLEELALPPNGWHRVEIDIDGATGSIAIDGRTPVSFTLGCLPPAGDFALTAGASASGANTPLSIWVDDVRFWTR